ncbi:hypothetical protein ABZW32_19375 [Streptomyces sp. NPDC004667]|uniref:hypothetical protein n=1 Tax=Streptomyces sp. NPDC004667 TaxID=3154285 RepID=UPI0033A0732B
MQQQGHARLVLQIERRVKDLMGGQIPARELGQAHLQRQTGPVGRVQGAVLKIGRPPRTEVRVEDLPVNQAVFRGQLQPAGEVLAPDGDVVVSDPSEDLPDPGGRPVRPGPAEAAKPKSVVPMRRAGLVWSALSQDYQRILRALADRDRLGQGPLTCQETAGCFGLDPVPAKVEALRSKAKRLVARGWLAESAPGRFTLAKDVAGPGGGS